MVDALCDGIKYNRFICMTEFLCLFSAVHIASFPQAKRWLLTLSISFKYRGLGLVAFFLALGAICIYRAS